MRVAFPNVLHPICCGLSTMLHRAPMCTHVDEHERTLWGDGRHAQAPAESLRLCGIARLNLELGLLRRGGIV